MLVEFAPTFGAILFLVVIGFSQPTNANAIVEVNSTAEETTVFDNNTSFSTYIDDDVGFSMHYPADWRVKTEGLTSNAIVGFSPPPDYEVEVNVYLFPRKNGESLKTYGDAEFKENPHFKISAYYRNATTTIGGLPVIKAIGTYFIPPGYLQQGSQTTYRIVSVTTFLKNQDSFFDVRYFADKSNFKDYFSIFQKMVDSVTLTDKPPTIQEED